MKPLVVDALSRWKWILIGLWLALTLSMAGWWMYFALSLVERLHGDDLERQRNMLLWEGAAWMVLLLIGGVTLIYLATREQRAARAIRGFVARFSHDLKTSLASLRLQAESLEDDLKGTNKENLAHRLSKDTLRLQIQLENSLYLASEKDLKLFSEVVDLAEHLEGISEQWNELNIVVKGQGFVRADRKALHSVFSNLFQNARTHGRASQVQVNIVPASKGAVINVNVADNGQGFEGVHEHLGRLFQRSSPQSGTGVGLYIVKELMRKMRGSVTFDNEPSGGFLVRLQFPAGEAMK